MVEFLQQHWLLIVFILAAAGTIAYFAIKEPQRIKLWLIWACAQAELALGSGTGMLRLREVYDIFITQYPIFSKDIPFSVFQKWTEEALLVFKQWLESNTIAQKMFIPQSQQGEVNEKE